MVRAWDPEDQATGSSDLRMVTMEGEHSQPKSGLIVSRRYCRSGGADGVPVRVPSLSRLTWRRNYASLTVSGVDWLTTREGRRKESMR
jgi:hypothetical protein